MVKPPTPPHNPVLDMALALWRSGVNVVAVKNDGSKAPAIPSWKEYITRRQTEDEVRRMFSVPNVNIAIINGVVSGGRFVLDFETTDARERFFNLLEVRNPGLANALRTMFPIVRTPKGFHLHLRYAQPLKSEVLARTEDEAILIELLAEGHLTNCPPSLSCHHPSGRPYLLESGDLCEAFELDAEDLAATLECARTLNEFTATTKPAQPRPAPSTAPRRTSDREVRAGDDFNRNGAHRVAELLYQHGWQNGTAPDSWVRPGKNPKDGISATLNSHKCPGKFHPFTSEGYPFEQGKSYDYFCVYALLEHGGDFAAAAKALHNEGYGTQKPAPKIETKPTTETTMTTETPQATFQPPTAKRPNPQQRTAPTPAKAETPAQPTVRSTYDLRIQRLAPAIGDNGELMPEGGIVWKDGTTPEEVRRFQMRADAFYREGQLARAWDDVYTGAYLRAYCKQADLPVCETFSFVFGPRERSIRNYLTLLNEVSREEWDTGLPIKLYGQIKGMTADQRQRIYAEYRECQEETGRGMSEERLANLYKTYTGQYPTWFKQEDSQSQEKEKSKDGRTITITCDDPRLKYLRQRDGADVIDSELQTLFEHYICQKMSGESLPAVTPRDKIITRDKNPTANTETAEVASTHTEDAPISPVSFFPDSHSLPAHSENSVTPNRVTLKYNTGVTEQNQAESHTDAPPDVPERDMIRQSIREELPDLNQPPDCLKDYHPSPLTERTAQIVPTARAG